MDQPEIDLLAGRCGEIREIYLPNDRADGIQRDIRTVHFRDNGSSGEGGIVVLIGGAGSGKSKLLADYAEGFPDEPGAITEADGEFADRKDVIGSYPHV
jgi:ABC-type dipeptide/oligopeptide/nickel transport system ATPase component